MDFADLKTELSDRGFSYLDATRLGRYVNNARAELDRMYLWPWREAFVTGLAPLTVSDLGTVEAVMNTSQSSVPLDKRDYRHLLELYGDLSTAGSPSYYYLARPTSAEVATYPISATDLIGVQYWKVTTDLVDATDTPASPTEAHYTIVDIAVRRAYRDSENHTEAEAIQSEIDRAISSLVLAYPPGIADGPDFQHTTPQDY